MFSFSACFAEWLEPRRRGRKIFYGKSDMPGLVLTTFSA
jgi:hypothetical protein